MRGAVNNQKGFTLVEIMMVVIIIGILAVLAIPRYEKYTIESKLSEVAVSTSEIKTGMEKYYNSHGNKYTNISGVASNRELERILRVDLGQQENFMFHIVTLSQNGYTGYYVIAFLTVTGKDNNYTSSQTSDRVMYYFPKELNSYWNEQSWVKGWNDDDFFVDGQATTNGLKTS